MFTTFDYDYIIRVFSEKIRKGDSNPIVFQSERDKNRFVIVTPVFNKNKFLVDTIETEISIKEENIQLPKNIREVIPTCNKILNRGKDMFRKFMYDLDIFSDNIEGPRGTFLGVDDEGYEVWSVSECWKRVI